MANPNNGRFTWHELRSTDVAAAMKFYQGLFGWDVEEMDLGYKYYLLTIDGKEAGGAVEGPPDKPSAWLVYVGAEDPDATVKRATELGGNERHPPFTVVDMMRLAVAADPQGAAFGVMEQLGANAAAAPPEGS